MRAIRHDRGDGVLLEGGERERPERVPRTQQARRQAERGRGEREACAPVPPRVPKEGDVDDEEHAAAADHRVAWRSPSCVSQCTPPSGEALVRAGRRRADPAVPKNAVATRDDGDGRRDQAEPPARADVEAPLRELERKEDRRERLERGRERPERPPSALAPAATAASTSSIITASLWPPPAKWSARSGLQPRNATAAAFRVRSATRTIEARSAATASARYASSARCAEVPAASAGTVPTATHAGPYGVGSRAPRLRDVGERRICGIVGRRRPVADSRGAP